MLCPVFDQFPERRGMSSRQSHSARGARARIRSVVVAALLALGTAIPAIAATGEPTLLEAPKPAIRPKPQAVRPSPVPVSATRITPATAQKNRIARINLAKSWGYQLSGLSIDEAARSPYDLLVVDATTGLAAGRPFLAEEVARLKRKPDGTRRLVVSYVSVGEAEDYRPDYFTSEYMTEDAPDWLMQENRQWKGNRIIRFCSEGWQKTILGDENGRNVYNSIDPSPLYRLLDLGFDGIYLDRVDVYAEVEKDCPNAESKMVDFISRLGAHARKGDPNFLVILQNAEELVRHPRMMDAIDAIAKEDLFYGADHSQRANDAGSVRDALGHLKAVKASGRPVFVVDYLKDAGKRADAKRRIQEQGFIPYIAPRDLGALWLPGRDF
jgi:cysteinyl-tRNA synthetase